ncbi:DUF4265 domain-containing protein [Pseudomonas sp. Bi130]|jgi:hypothetical protein|uniref:DUF4265 domain-containing protein n=1 Tax=unclassified Pseudomonas TaxID=196821 RepID=UPI001D1E3DD4|nr:DUF4265 domain-containing protein [Pseudomonas sp. Bi130]CAH0267864.1 hypothetical protein SRABI130_03696 [Pseudomonas sp. Bi130]
MDDKQSSELIRVYAGDNDEGPVFERLPARRIDEDTYELLSSPGLALNLARGDIISIKNQQTHAEVLKRGGNFCIHIYSDHIPQECLTALEVDVGNELNGTLDGIYKGNLSLAVPSKNGMDKIGKFFNEFREKTGIQWYYANVYKNIDDEDDETLLNWWLDS